MRPLILFATFLVGVALAQLTYKDADGNDLPAPPTQVVFVDASEKTTMSFFYKGPKLKSATVTPANGIFTADEPILQYSNGVTNITSTFTPTEKVGVEDYTVSVVDNADATAELTGKLISAGFVIMQGGKVVSGDEATGVTVGASGSETYDVKAIGVDGAPITLDDTCKIDPAATVGTYMEEVNKAGTKFSGNQFTLAFNEGRYGTGSYILRFSCPQITYEGEIFETVLYVKQTIPATVPCYVRGGSYEINKSGLVKIIMYNLQKPPQAAPVSKISLSVAGVSYDYDDPPSDRSLPTQTIVFAPEASGRATITCDGVAAKVNGNGGIVTITGSPPQAPKEGTLLAADFTESLAESTTKDIVTAKIIFTESSKKLLTKSKADAMCAAISKAMGASTCKLEKVTTGSAICDYAVYVDKGDGNSAVTKLKSCFSSGTCQAAAGETKDTCLLDGHKVIASNALGGAAAGLTPAVTLATWVIVLIAVVGAFAIILLIMLALWAVYRRNAEQSESDYSSSGPLGVPDPSDLLYEQSIVRDIYGRGDFPEGGPSAAAAAERAREADLREEFPRPPSSSAVSRGDAQTDDASSTYSV